jgi:hypothetical protein
MSGDDETFVSRWSRLKRQAPEREKAIEEKKAVEAQPAPVLPPVEKLTPESDFRDFMHPKVDDKLRRVALKKLFSDPHFNIPDPYEAYSGDWTVGEPITPEFLATLNQARTVLFPEEEKKRIEEEQAKEQAKSEEPKHDEPGRQDT